MKNFVIILFISVNSIYSQEYLVLHNGDTLFGKTKRIKTSIFDNFIKFQINGEKKASKIPLEKVFIHNNRKNKKYYYFEGEYGWYISAKLEISGEIELYSYEGAGTPGYNGQPTIAIKYILKRKGFGMRFFSTRDIKPRKYRKNTTPFIIWFKSLFKENNELLQIYEGSKMKIENLKKLVTEFNLSYSNK